MTTRLQLRWEIIGRNLDGLTDDLPDDLDDTMGELESLNVVDIELGEFMRTFGQRIEALRKHAIVQASSRADDPEMGELLARLYRIPTTDPDPEIWGDAVEAVS